jgi:flagellar basal-body rod protein FlgB
MFQNLEIFQMATGMARHAGQKQAMTARNMANADTPDYRARAITPFKETLSGGKHGAIQKATRAGHLNGADRNQIGIRAPSMHVDEAQPTDPNGNSVSVEQEILRSVDAKRQHDRAIAIYRSSLKILRSSLGR